MALTRNTEDDFSIISFQHHPSFSRSFQAFIKWLENLFARIYDGFIQTGNFWDINVRQQPVTSLLPGMEVIRIRARATRHFLFVWHSPKKEMQASLVSELEQVLAEAECKPRQHYNHITCDVVFVSCTAFLAGVLSFGNLAYLLVVDDYNRNEALIAYSSVHAVVLIMFAFGMLAFGRWLHVLPRNARLHAVRSTLDTYQHEDSARGTLLPRKFSTPTLRNGKWINVPNNFICKADIVALQSGKRAPTNVQRVADGMFVNRDDVLPPVVSGNRAGNGEEGVLHLMDVEQYKVMASPLVDDVTRFLYEANTVQETEFGRQLVSIGIRTRVAAFTCALVFAVLIGGLAHEFSQPDWVLVFLIRPVGLLCLFPALSWPLFRFAIEFYWTRRMQAIGGQSKPAMSCTFLPSTLVHVMGTVTTLCNLDEETLLHGSIVEEMFVLATKEYKVLDCCLDEDNKLRFEDPHWRQYMDVLKPIGLACSLMDTRPLLQDQLDVRALPLAHYFLRDDPRIHFSQLAQAMGLSRHQFRVHSRFIFVEETTLLRKRRYFECMLVGADTVTTTAPTAPAAAAAQFQMLCFGDSSLLLQFCTDYWNGEAISPLDSEFRSQTEQMIKQWDKEDLVSTMFAYRPWTMGPVDVGAPNQCSLVVLGSNGASAMLPQQQHEGSNEDRTVQLVCESLARGQIFTGMLGSPDLPKPEIASLVDTLWTCGIRFVYFSPRDTRKTRKIAEKLGLDTDWNTSISLSSVQQDDIAGDVNVAAWELKARLPRGIAAIRTHIQSVDDVPLRVSVFTETSPDTVGEMINVMRDWGEVAAVYGSPLCGGNVKAFLQANASIAILPRSMDGGGEQEASMHFAILPCAFSMYDDEIPLLLSLLGEGRVALYNFRQANQAFLALCLAALCTQCIVFCAGNTEAFTLGHVLWLSWVQIPLIACPPALRPRSKQEMLRRRMPWKKSAVPNLPNPIRRFVCYTVVRLLPCVVLVVVVFFWALSAGKNTVQWNAQEDDEDNLVAAQSMALLAFVWCANLVAATFASRTKLRVEIGFAFVWFAFAIITVCLQLVYNCLFAEFMVGSCAAAFPSSTPLWLVLVFAPPVIVPLVAFPVKRHDATFDLRAMRMLRLDFETKLGQFSPK